MDISPWLHTFSHVNWNEVAIRAAFFPLIISTDTIYRWRQSFKQGVFRVDPVLCDEPSSKIDSVHGHLSSPNQVPDMGVVWRVLHLQLEQVSGQIKYIVIENGRRGFGVDGWHSVEFCWTGWLEFGRKENKKENDRVTNELEAMASMASKKMVTPFIVIEQVQYPCVT